MDGLFNNTQKWCEFVSDCLLASLVAGKLLTKSIWEIRASYSCRKLGTFWEAVYCIIL